MCGGYFVISQILHIISLLLLNADLEILSLRLPHPLIHNLLLTPSIIKAQTSPPIPIIHLGTSPPKQVHAVFA